MISITELKDWAERQVVIANEILSYFRTEQDIESNPKGFEHWTHDKKLAEAAAEIFGQLAASEDENKQYR